MKKFFAMNGRFTIFTLIGFLIACSYLLFQNIIILITGVLVSWIPDIKQSITTYKNEGYINFTLVFTAILLVYLLIVLVFKTY